MAEDEWVRFDDGWYRVAGRAVLFRFDPPPRLPDPYVWSLPATAQREGG